VRARTSAVLVVAVTGLVAVYLAVRAVDLLRTGSLKGGLLGVGVLLLVLLGGLLLVGEVRLGAGSARLARRLEDEGGLPLDPPEVQRLPSGRMRKQDADAVFATRREEVERAPEDWRPWWRLAAAYGEARDTPRGRRAMRRAVGLEKAERDREREGRG